MQRVRTRAKAVKMLARTFVARLAPRAQPAVAVSARAYHDKVRAPLCSEPSLQQSLGTKARAR